MIRFSESKFCIKMLVFVLSFLVILITRKAQVRSIVTEWPQIYLMNPDPFQSFFASLQGVNELAACGIGQGIDILYIFK